MEVAPDNHGRNGRSMVSSGDRNHSGAHIDLLNVDASGKSCVLRDRVTIEHCTDARPRGHIRYGDRTTRATIARCGGYERRLRPNGHDFVQAAQTIAIIERQKAASGIGRE
ncbi:hypothetical protein D3C85_1668790 [compost metagenome]